MPVEGTWRSHQVPLADVRDEPRAPGAARGRGCAATGPRSCSTSDGRARARARGAAARGRAADEREPARERRPAAARPRAARLPRLRGRGRPRRARRSSEATRVLGEWLRDVDRARTRRRFRIFGPDETASNRLGAVFEATDRAWEAETSAGRRAPRAGRARDGGALGAPVPGLARGLPAHRPARPVQLLRGVHPHRRLDVQPAREVAEGHARHPVAAADRLAQLPAHLARLAPGPQRLLAPGPGLHRPRRQQEGRDHPRLPAAGREHACSRSPTTACAAATT